MKIRTFVLVPMLVLLLAGCSKNPISASRATREASAPTVATAAPRVEATATVAPPIVNGETVSPLTASSPAYDDLITQAMPYGGLAMLQGLLLAVASHGHPTGRRVGLSLLSFGLVTIAALFALFSRAAVVDAVGFVAVTLMSLAAMAQVFRPAGVRRG